MTDESHYIIPIGTVVPEYGTIEAIGFLSGERYYFMRDGNAVSMIPAFIVESLAE